MRLAAHRGLAPATLVSLCVLVAARSAAAPTPLPAEASFLPDTLKLSRPVAYEPWNELKFPENDGKPQAGKHWQILAAAVSGAGDKPAAWSIVKAAFLKNRWTLVAETTGTQPLYGTMHFAQKGVEAWANVGIGNPSEVGVDVIEVAPPPYILTFTPPQATPEAIIPEKGDFPYLTPLPGTKFSGGRSESDPFSIVPEGASQPEIVANGSILKWYPPPEGMTNALFMAEYRTALIKAGWVIAKQFNSADAAILAHYTEQGRNLWASLHLNVDGLQFRVADAGAKDLGKALSADCHVALIGLLFDFNKATLQAASEPVLQQVLELLMNDPSLAVEIQGHTDNVGTDFYNQTLSEARAFTVVAWLKQNGVPSARLTAKGYGKTKPVADNRDDAGRARNRRVEIADPRCVPKGK